TAYYRWTHLVSLCEVGAPADRFGVGADELHEHARRTIASWPATMTAGATHDSKRGEDVRARIGAISAHADEWVALVRHLRAATADLRPVGPGGRAETPRRQAPAGTRTPAGPLAAQRHTPLLPKPA